jgi:phage-related protein (TIGR01555 family)
MSKLISWAKSLKEFARSDGWENVVTMLGTTSDKLSYHRVYGESWYDTDELEDLYYSDPFAQRVIREPVDAAFRQGYDLTYGGKLDAETIEDDRKAIEDLLFDLKAEHAYKEAQYWGRLYGIGGLLLGVDDGLDPSEPLDVEKIQEGGFLYTEPLTYAEMTWKDSYDDPKEPKFGEPKIWLVTRTSSGSGSTSESVEVHESRIILARGIPTSQRKREENGWRDASYLQAPFRYLRNWDSAQMGVANMLTDASQAVIKITDFVKLLASEEIAIFTNRMRIMELARSLRIMLIDAEKEAFEYVERTFAGIGDLLDKTAGALAGAVGMPQTVLFGRSPSGLSATGESDIRGWYDEIEARRTEAYQPDFERLIYYAALATGADAPETWGMSWHSLWQETEKEKADREKVIADTDKVYWDMGAVTEDEVADTRFSGDEFNSGVIQIDLEARAALKEQDLERAKEGIPEDPFAPPENPFDPQPPEEEDNPFDPEEERSDPGFHPEERED